MYLENKTEISYSKNIEIQFRNMYTHFKKEMVKNMKNWRKIMAGLCAAAMVSSMVVPVWAAEETTEEAADDGDEADYNQTYQDMGDLGSATVQEATLAVAVQGLKYAVENGTEMN